MQSPPYKPRSPARLALIGFMGAGKSTTGPILAERLGWRFIDTDHFLEKRCGSTIAGLFSDLGESEFRRMEAELIAELHRETELVLALGGGAIESESTRRLYAGSSDSCIIFLKAPLDVLVARCEQQPGAAVRPVLNQREALHQRFDSRQRYYESADITVETQGVSPTGVADLILNKLQQRYLAPLLPVKAGTI